VMVGDVVAGTRTLPVPDLSPQTISIPAPAATPLATSLPTATPALASPELAVGGRIGDANEGGTPAQVEAVRVELGTSVLAAVVEHSTDPTRHAPGLLLALLGLLAALTALGERRGRDTRRTLRSRA
jgi:hypothetical protein